MDYVLLIHAAESRYATMSPEEQGALFRSYGKFTKELMTTGRSKPGAALESVGTATSVRIRGGKVVLTDGPFAETKEQLGGYYVITSDDMDEVFRWAAKIPDAVNGSIEVRPLPPMGGPSTPTPTGPKPEGAKEYMLLIYEPESRWATMGEAERSAIFSRYSDVSADMRKAGAYIDGSALSRTSDAKTVRVREGKRVVSDGPFAETKEQLGGFYRLWARNLDEAVEFAKKIPAAETGTVEVRPVMDTSMMDS